MQFSQDVQTIFVGQREIEQDKIKRMVSGTHQSLVARGSRRYFVALEFQQSLQRLANFRFVINDQNEPGRRGRGIVGAASRDDGCFRH